MKTSLPRNLLTAVCLLATPSAGRAAENEALFRDLTFEQALAAAGQEEKLVFVDFFTTWCGPCKKLDRETWPEENVQRWLREKAVPLKIDAEEQAELAKRYYITAYPTMLFIQPDGSEHGRLRGYVGPEKFLEEAARITAGPALPFGPPDAEEAAKATSPTLRQEFGDRYADLGMHAEALEQFLWCFDHGLEHQRSYGGVRLSFLLGRIAQLGRKYPPALGALRDRRDASVTQFSTEGGFISLQEILRLNDVLGEQEATVKLYDELNGASRLGPFERQQFIEALMDYFVSERRFADVVQGVGDPVGFAERKLSIPRSFTEMTGDKEAGKRLMDRAINQLSSVYLAFATEGEAEKASQLAELLIAESPTATTYVLLARAANNAKQGEAAAGFARRGLELEALEKDERSELTEVLARSEQSTGASNK